MIIILFYFVWYFDLCSIAYMLPFRNLDEFLCYFATSTFGRKSFQSIFIKLMIDETFVWCIYATMVHFLSLDTRFHSSVHLPLLKANILALRWVNAPNEGMSGVYTFLSFPAHILISELYDSFSEYQDKFFFLFHQSWTLSCWSFSSCWYFPY